MLTGTPKRIAILGLLLESNRFAPETVKEDFLNRLYLAGNEILSELGKPESKLPAEVHGFCNTMDSHESWEPLPILIGLVEAGGPMNHDFFKSTFDDMKARLEAAMPLDGVYIANHGAMITTGSTDPDGEIFSMVRSIVGPEVPIIATLDLHGNVSETMVDKADAIIAYRTNPHVDMVARGAEAAEAMNAMFDGMRPGAIFIRLPLTPPTVTLLTETGPYADLIDYGQSRMTEEILNVSILGGFAYSDTPKNGLAIIVTGRDGTEAANTLARDIAKRAWSDHKRYVPRLTPLEDAIAMAVKAGNDSAFPALIFADVADNPGGGGNGNTMWILEALHKAKAKGVIAGIINDADLAREAHELGEGASFNAVFNRHNVDSFSETFEAKATIIRLKDGDCVGRRGFYAQRRMNVGPSTLLDLDGIKVVVISIRTQCADPVFFEMMDLDIAEARTVVVKSRGHFRAGFDEFFAPGQVIEVDTPGLTSPVLSRFDFQNLPRPVFPVDTEVEWQVPACTP